MGKPNMMIRTTALALLALSGTAVALDCFTAVCATNCTSFTTSSTGTCPSGSDACQMSKTVSTATSPPTTSYIMGCQAGTPTTAPYGTTGCVHTDGTTTISMITSATDFGTKTPAELKSTTDAITADCAAQASPSAATAAPSMIVACALAFLVILKFN